LPRDARSRRTSVLGLLLAITAFGAEAATPRLAFNIPAGPLNRALLDFATQAGVSIGVSRTSACAPQGHALVGQYNLEDGLKRILAGSGCGYRFIDARAIEITPLPPKPPIVATVARAPATVDIAELVVVATRRPTPAGRLAYPVSAIENRTLQSQGIADTAGIALIVPSMTVTNLGAGRDKILLRGLSDGPLTGRTQSMVGIYLDDVRLTYNAPDPDLRLTDMAQVEVLRGPQGALYGSGSLGGVVHYITQAPDPSTPGGWVSVAASTTRGGAPSAVVEGMVNLPAPWRGGAARLVAYREVDGGYIDDPALRLSNVNRTVRQGFRLSALQKLDEDWTLKAGVMGQSINADDTQYALASGPAYQRRNLLREPHDNDFSEGHVGLEGALDWGDVRWSTAAVRHRVVSRYDASTAPPVATPPGAIAYDDDDAISSLVSEATLAAKDGAPIQWLAGAFYAHTRQGISLSLTPQPTGAPVFGETRRDRLSERALFGQAALPLGHGLTLTLGGRAFASDTVVSSVVTAAGAAPNLVSNRVSRSGFAPKIVLAYDPTAGAVVYIEAAEGYRTGGVNTTGATNQVFSAPPGPEPYRLYQADELWSFEAGGRFRLLNDRLTLRAALFEALWKNIQSDELLATGLPFTANIGDGSNRGVELEAAWRSGALVVHSALLINGPELDKANPAFPVRPEIGLAGVPRVSASTSAGYSWDLGNDRTVSLDGRLVYTGPSHLTFDATTSPRMGGYATARLAAALVDKQWRVTAAVDNLTDTHGNTFAYGNPFTLRSTAQVTPLRPRTFTVSVARRF
jgi:iron complex outermembrane receptor protein